MEHGSDAIFMVRCDFCSSIPFVPQAFNQRTCHRCAARGAPDQSKIDWKEYQKAVADYLRDNGIRAQLSGAAIAARGRRGVPGAFSGSRKPNA